MFESTEQFVLLRAGPSVDAGIKAVFSMPREFIRLFAEDYSCRRQSHALRYVVGGLMMEKGAKDEDPFDGVNIEDVFNAMQTLVTRQLFEERPPITYVPAAQYPATGTWMMTAICASGEPAVVIPTIRQRSFTSLSAAREEATLSRVSAAGREQGAVVYLITFVAPEQNSGAQTLESELY